ncbi:hypothetical protein [Thioclava kandeliae]|uniref:Uncharacterized protein n=1 Tax=Thioclava kandeliae TaxID=3070818 RepID=A0ABV1SKD1_9RHOB
MAEPSKTSTNPPEIFHRKKQKFLRRILELFIFSKNRAAEKKREEMTRNEIFRSGAKIDGRACG